MRLIFMSLLTIICGLFSCTAQTDNYKSVEVEDVEKAEMVGAYTEGRIPTKDEIELFKDTYKGGIELTPITVSTQVVAGTNYKFVCKDKCGSTYKVVIYQKLPAYGGEAEVTSIEKEYKQD